MSPTPRFVIAYIDLKSPHAYLAMGPMWNLVDELGVQVDWRPLTPDYAKYLGSARLDGTGRVVQQDRTERQWAHIKTVYRDCRRYADLNGIYFRGTTKVWNSTVSGIAMLWAKRQGESVMRHFLERSFDAFWRQRLDIEDTGSLKQALEQAGASIEGFDEFVAGDGALEHEANYRAAMDAGIFGIPTFIVGDQVYFGREHFARIRWQLTGENGPPPDVANPFPASAEQSPGGELNAYLDFKCAHSYLALRRLRTIQSRSPEFRPQVRIWIRPDGEKMLPVEQDDAELQLYRSSRAAYNASDLNRYAPHPLKLDDGNFDPRLASLGAFWVADTQPSFLDAYVDLVFRRRWYEHKAVDTHEAIEAIFDQARVPHAGFRDFASNRGPRRLAESQEAIAAVGIITTPTFVLDTEIFVGRQQLPLLQARVVPR